MLKYSYQFIKACFKRRQTGCYRCRARRKEPGAVHGGIEEKDLNIDIALRLNKQLKTWC